MKMIHESEKIMLLKNLAVIRHIALNILKQDKNIKGSIKGKRKCAGWDNSYLLKLLKQ